MYQDSQNKGNNQHQQGGQTNYGNNQSGGDFGVTGGAHLNRPCAAVVSVLPCRSSAPS